MARIEAYHAELIVDMLDRVVKLEVDLYDWYEDQEILRELAISNPDFKTVGDLVEAVENNERMFTPAVITGLRVSPVTQLDTSSNDTIDCNNPLP